jgi:hypothetical protein
MSEGKARQGGRAGSHRRADEVHAGGGRDGVEVDLLHQHRDVDARIALASDVELMLGVLRIEREPVDQELVGVDSGRLVLSKTRPQGTISGRIRSLTHTPTHRVHTLLVGLGVVAIREPHSLGGLQIQHVCDFCPAVVVVKHLTCEATKSGSTYFVPQSVPICTYLRNPINGLGQRIIISLNLSIFAELQITNMREITIGFYHSRPMRDDDPGPPIIALPISHRYILQMTNVSYH